MRIAVVGSRDFPDEAQVREYVRSLPRTAMVVSGGARGVDTFAEYAARERRLSRLIYEPEVEDGAPKAVYVDALLARNTRIVRVADLVVAFHDGESRGTRDAIEKARRLGKPVDIRGPR
jgi:hypothetical protein